MREFVRPVTAALSIACLAALMASVSTGSALAQAKMAPAEQAMPQPEPIKQVPLTDKQVEGVIAAAKDMDAITEKLPDNAKPDPKVTAQLEADKKMSAKDKKDALADLNQALKAPEPPLQNKGNIDVVTKYYDKLAAIMGDDQQ